MQWALDTRCHAPETQRLTKYLHGRAWLLMNGLQQRKHTLQDRPSTRHLLVCQGIHAHRWPEFKRMVDEKEAAMLRAFTALEGVNAAGKVELKQIKACSLAPVLNAQN